MSARPHAALERAVAHGCVAAAIAAVALGAMALLRVASTQVDSWLTWRSATQMLGPGVIAVGVWLASWAILRLAWREPRVDRRVVAIWGALLVLALVLAFPPLDQLFA